jgi:hypothetical protein
LVNKKGNYDALKEEEEFEGELQDEIRFYNDKLAKKLEENLKVKAELDYEINKNWIEFREKKKELEQKNHDLKTQLQNLKDNFQWNTDMLHQKSNLSTIYFEMKREEIKGHQKSVK